MNKRVKKYIVLLLAITICFSSMAVTALAAPATGGGQDTSQPVQRESDGIMLTFDLGGGSGLHDSKVEKGTKINELKTPVRDGYEFDGWEINGKTVDDSYVLNSDAFLKATWAKATADQDDNSSRVSSTSKGSESAAATVGSATSSPSSAPASAASSQAPAGTRYSMLFYVGILLVVLGVGGLLLLIFRQFHNRGGKGGPGSSGGSRNSEFTDISSYSDGRKHYTNITPDSGEHRQPVRAASEPQHAAGNAANFNWEKFFNEQSDS